MKSEATFPHVVGITNVVTVHTEVGVLETETELRTPSARTTVTRRVTDEVVEERSREGDSLTSTYKFVNLNKANLTNGQTS